MTMMCRRVQKKGGRRRKRGGHRLLMICAKIMCDTKFSASRAFFNCAGFCHFFCFFSFFFPLVFFGNFFSLCAFSLLQLLSFRFSFVSRKRQFPPSFRRSSIRCFQTKIKTPSALCALFLSLFSRITPMNAQKGER